MYDLTGQTFGKYRLIRMLSNNEIAQIYLGEHIFLKRQDVVKVLRGQVTEELQAGFLAEAQIIASLEHPHIVRILDFGVESQLSYLVMNYASNGTLRQRHQQGSQLSLTIIEIYLKQIASALQYAHEHHVIHRDVKPQNMLIGLNDEILLSDFGLAIIFESTSSQNLLQQTGTVTYMAPEQFQGKAYPASDQYALGVVVYEWLCGESPFHGTDREIAMQHQFAPPPLLNEKDSTIPTELEQVVLKALAKDPKARFACVQDFASAFDQACHAPSPAGTVSPDSPDQRPQPSITPPLSLGSSLVHRPRAMLDRQRRLPTWTRILLGLMALIAIGSLGLFAPAFIPHHASVSLTATPQPAALATAAAQAYAAATSKGVMAGFDAQHTNFNPYERVLSPTNVSHLVLAWTVSLGGPIDSSPTVANGVVYIGSEDRKLYAFDASTGKLRWTASIGGPIVSSPAVANGIVYIDSEDHKLYAFDASTGKLRWSSDPTRDFISSAPVVVNGVIYINSDSSSLYAFAASTGKQLWAVPLEGVSILSPVVANNIVYIIVSDFNLYAFDAFTGKFRWSTANIPVNFAGISAPTVANNTVYAASSDGKFYAFDASTGKLRWSTTDLIRFANDTTPAIANDVVYVGSSDYANSSGGKLYAFDASTGHFRWFIPGSGSLTTSPTVANGIIYIGSGNILCAFDASTGKQLWIIPTDGGAFHSSPAVANGVVYVDSAYGGLYAFHLSGIIS